MKAKGIAKAGRRGDQGPGSGGSFLPGRALPWDEMVPPSCGSQALWTEWSRTTAHERIGPKPSLPLSDVQEHAASCICRMFQNIENRLEAVTELKTLGQKAEREIFLGCCD